ncbi:MAG: hypothetical protein JSW34_05990 [Candidatus Zixiibacteriota bacterium]|nr:MAG: hypothetical protein JSW34_05990 [candidate division Zixibacteria bacterium]
MGKFILVILVCLILLPVFFDGVLGAFFGLLGGLLGVVVGVIGAGIGLVVGLIGAVVGLCTGLALLLVPLLGLALVIGGIVLFFRVVC